MECSSMDDKKKLNEYTLEELQKLNFSSLRILCFETGIDTNVVESKDELISLIQRNLCVDATPELQIILQDFIKIRVDYLEILDRITHLTKNIPRETSLKQDMIIGISEIADEMKKNECKILICGDVSSGKSLFLNLLLGTKVLPSHARACTSTITELKYAKEPKLLIKDKNSQITEIEVSTSDAGKKLEKYVSLLSNERKEESFSNVTLYWPASILECGITLIDSPGLNETENMDNIVLGALTTIDAVVCIVNCTMGITKSLETCLVELLKKVSNAKILMIGTHIDQVNNNQINEVKNMINYRLSVILKPYQTQVDIHYINLNEAVAAMQSGVQHVKCKNVLTNLADYSRKCFLSKITNTMQKVINILTETSLTFNFYGALELKDREILLCQVQNLKENFAGVKSQLDIKVKIEKAHLDTRIQTLLRNTSVFHTKLRSSAYAFMTTESLDSPEISKSFEDHLTSTLLRYLARANLVLDFVNDLLEAFSEVLSQYFFDVQELQGRVKQLLVIDDKESRASRLNYMIRADSSRYVGLFVPKNDNKRLDKRKKIFVEQKFLKWKEERLEAFIQYIAKPEFRQSLIEKLVDVQKIIDFMIDYVKKQIEHHKIILETKPGENLRVLLNEIDTLASFVWIFNIRHLIEPDFNIENLVIFHDKKSEYPGLVPIIVHEGSLQRDDVTKPVLVKEISLNLEENDNEPLYQFRFTDTILRKLRNQPVVISYYGISKDPKKNKLYGISQYPEMGSLDNLLKNRPDDLMKNITRIIKSLAIVFRDLERNEINFCCFTLHDIYLEKDFTCEISSLYPIQYIEFLPKHLHLLMYLDPEILLAIKSNRSYYLEKAYQYSFAVLVWQLYTGINPFENFQSLLDSVEKTRGELWSLDCIPKDMHAMIRNCWSSNVQDRPTWPSIVNTVSISSAIENNERTRSSKRKVEGAIYRGSMMNPLFRGEKSDSKIFREIFDSCLNGDLDNLKIKIKSDSKLDQKDDRFNQETLLHIASRQGHRSIVSWLIGMKANIDAQEYNSNTPLHLAVKQCNSEIVKILIDMKANINAQEYNLNTPLHLAVQQCNSEIVKILIDMKAQTNIRNYYNLLAIEEAMLRREINKDDSNMVMKLTNIIKIINHEESRNYAKKTNTVEQLNKSKSKQFKPQTSLDKRQTFDVDYVNDINDIPKNTTTAKNQEEQPTTTTTTTTTPTRNSTWKKPVVKSEHRASRSTTDKVFENSPTESKSDIFTTATKYRSTTTENVTSEPKIDIFKWKTTVSKGNGSETTVSKVNGSETTVSKVNRSEIQKYPPLETWTVKNVYDWAIQIGIPEGDAKKLEQGKIDGEILKICTREDLVACGLSIGQAIKLMYNALLILDYKATIHDISHQCIQYIEKLRNNLHYLILQISEDKIIPTDEKWHNLKRLKDILSQYRKYISIANYSWTQDYTDNQQIILKRSIISECNTVLSVLIDLEMGLPLQDRDVMQEIFERLKIESSYNSKLFFKPK